MQEPLPERCIPLCGLPRRGKRGLHLAAQLHRPARCVISHVGPKDRAPRTHRVEQLDLVRQPERERTQMLAELKREVGQLVLRTTASVTGKVLTSDDQRRLSEETARQLG